MNALDVLNDLGIAAPDMGAADARTEWLQSRLGKITASQFWRIGFLPDINIEGIDAEISEAASEDAMLVVRLAAATTAAETKPTATNEKALATAKRLLEKSGAKLDKLKAAKAAAIEQIRELEQAPWLRLTKGAQTYLFELIGEHLTGTPSKPEFSSAATDWGNEYEAEAADRFAELYDCKVSNGYLFTMPDTHIGGTPDRLILDDVFKTAIAAGVEIKCPFNPGVHARNLITQAIPPDYYEQCLGYMWLTGANYWWFVSYDPRGRSETQLFAKLIDANDPDTAADLAALRSKVLQFNHILNAAIAAL